MEHVIEGFHSRSFSVKAEDPYRLSHDLLHWCQQFGRVEEHRNRVLASGPRTVSRMEFTLKKHLDKFSFVDIKVKLDGHMALGRLDASIEASFRADLPASHGLVTAAFEAYYASRIFPYLLGTAKLIAEDLVEGIEKRAAALPLKALK
jgi:hypothetical protein